MGGFYKTIFESLQGEKMCRKSVVFALTATAIVIILTGCQQPTFRSTNLQCASIRGASDVAITAALDSTNDSNVIQVHNDMVTIAAAIQQFLNNEDVVNFTIPVLIIKLKELMPEQYSFLAELFVSQIQGLNMASPAKIKELANVYFGERNLLFVSAVNDGLLSGLQKYKIANRSVVIKTPASAAVATHQFGVVLCSTNRKSIEKFQDK